MSAKIIKFFDSQKSNWLQKTHPYSFLLFIGIIRRLSHESFIENEISIGECFIGDFQNFGLPSRHHYRIALANLVLLGIISIVDTNRNPNPNHQITTRGTRVRILKSEFYDTDWLLCNHFPEEKTIEKNTNLPRENPSFSTTISATNNCSFVYKKKETIKKKEPPILDQAPKLFLSYKMKEKISTPQKIEPKKELREDPLHEKISTLVLYLKDKGIDVKEFTVFRWIKLYSLEKIAATANLLCEQVEKGNGISNPGGWMEIALKENWVTLKENSSLNREFVLEYKRSNRAPMLEVHKSYCRDKNTGNEYYYKMSPQIFKTEILRKFG